ncbi:MAG: porin family protein [Woeseiaceae bacterium]|nr:porin family protein [Woeseiaceae bacterium]
MKVTRFTKLRSAAALAVLAGFLLGPAAYADSGFFLGAGLGNANVELTNAFDENDSASKVFGGFIFDMPVVDFAIEAAYVDLGSPSGTVLGDSVELDVKAISAFGVAGLDYGLFGFFAKAGLVSWDADIAVAGLQDSDSGSDPAYGLGFRLTFSSIEVRAEYEVFDVSDIDTVNMISLGALWRF